MKKVGKKWGKGPNNDERPRTKMPVNQHFERGRTSTNH